MMAKLIGRLELPRMRPRPTRCLKASSSWICCCSFVTPKARFVKSEPASRVWKQLSSMLETKSQTPMQSSQMQRQSSASCVWSLQRRGRRQRLASANYRQCVGSLKRQDASFAACSTSSLASTISLLRYTACRVMLKGPQEYHKITAVVGNICKMIGTAV